MDNKQKEKVIQYFNWTTRQLLKAMEKRSNFTEALATQALHYIYEQEGTIDNFLENYSLAEEFYEDENYEYYGFNKYGEENE